MPEPTSLVADMLAEIEAARAVLEPERDGFNMLGALLQRPDPPSAEVANDAAQRRQQRIDLLNAAHDALVALRDDDHPNDLPVTITEGMHRAIDTITADLTAAIGDTHVENEAASGTMTFGRPQP